MDSRRHPATRLGRLINAGAILLAYITTPWGLLVSGTLAFGAAMSNAAFSFFERPHVSLAVQTFLVTVWMLMGLRVLTLLGKTADVKVIPDYRYGISMESYQVAIDEEKEDDAFQIALTLRNHLNSAIKLKVEHFRVVIDDRVCPEGELGPIMIPRVATRSIRSGPFKKAVIKERMHGHYELRLIYGDPDGNFTRRFVLKAKLHVQTIKDANGKYAAANIVDEHDLMSDEPL